MGVPDFLPGTKLEKMNIGLNSRQRDGERQKIFKNKPKTLRQKGMLSIKAKND